MNASCSKDANRSAGSADWMLGVTNCSSMVGFIGEVPYYALVRIEGCTVWV